MTKADKAPDLESLHGDRQFTWSQQRLMGRAEGLRDIRIDTLCLV